MKATAMCWMLIMSLGFLAMNICTAEEIHGANWVDKPHGRIPFTRDEFVPHGGEQRESDHPHTRDWDSILGGRMRLADSTRWHDNGRQQSRHATATEAKSWREASGEDTPRDEVLASRSADLSARIRAPFGNKNAWVLYKRRSDDNNDEVINKDGNTRYDVATSRIKRRFMDKHSGFAVRAKSNAWILYKREGDDPFMSPQWAR